MEEENEIKEIEKNADTEIHDKKLLEAEYEDSGKKDNDSKAFEEEEKNNLLVSNVIIIRRSGCSYGIFAFIHSILCILSSYFYSWMACYGNEYSREMFFYCTLFIELFFLLSMFIEFITDYTEEGDEAPTRHIGKIAKRYLKNGFVMDFIPLFPI